MAGASGWELWDALPVGVVALAPDGGLLFANRQARAIYRLPCDDWRRAMDRVRFYRPDGRAYRPEELPGRRVRSGGPAAVDEPVDILRPDGTWATLTVNTSAVRAADGALHAVLATVQEAVGWQGAPGRRKVGLPDTAAATAPAPGSTGGVPERSVPSEDVTVRTRFLEVAAHELRNPMASVKAVLELADRRLAAPDGSGRVVELVRCAIEEIDRLSVLLNDVLEAFRASASHLAYRSDAVDVGQVARAALRPFQLAGGICRFFLVASDAPVWVRGDARRLEDMLRNLLSNARKYSPAGGEVQVTVRAEGGEALISVRDEGVGIPRDQLTAVFGPFVRAANLGDRDPGGLGLGLYISVGIVRQHGGRIWAENNPDRGVSFQVALPLAVAEGGDRPGPGAARAEVQSLGENPAIPTG